MQVTQSSKSAALDSSPTLSDHHTQRVLVAQEWPLAQQGLLSKPDTLQNLICSARGLHKTLPQMEHACVLCWHTSHFTQHRGGLPKCLFLWALRC